MNAQNLVNIGGSEWQKGSMHRVYFNNLAELYGLELDRYNSGNISSAFLDGEPISNSRATKLAHELRLAKIYYDVRAAQFRSQNLSDAAASKIVRAIQALAQQQEA